MDMIRSPELSLQEAVLLSYFITCELAPNGFLAEIPRVKNLFGGKISKGTFENLSNKGLITLEADDNYWPNWDVIMNSGLLDGGTKTKLLQRLREG